LTALSIEIGASWVRDSIFKLSNRKPLKNNYCFDALYSLRTPSFTNPCVGLKVPVIKHTEAPAVLPQVFKGVIGDYE
jgi:hypothetical protein